MGYLLRAGELKARQLYTEQFELKSCGRAASLAWHGDALLYSTSEQRVAVIDSSLQAAPIQLSKVIAQLSGPHRGGDGVFEASWSS